MLYLVEWSTRMLDAKLAAELRPGARIVLAQLRHGGPAGREDRTVDRLRRKIADAPALDRGKVGAEPVDESVSALTRPRSGPLEVAGLDELTLGRLAPLVGSDFAVALDAPWDLRLTLAEASPLSPQTSFTGAFRSPFRLIFHGPAQPVHPQQTLPLDHPQLGRVEIFLVPIGPDAVGMRYEAIFT